MNMMINARDAEYGDGQAAAEKAIIAYGAAQAGLNSSRTNSATIHRANFSGSDASSTANVPVAAARKIDGAMAKTAFGR